jgi:hypothetical protein
MGAARYYVVKPTIPGQSVWYVMARPTEETVCACWDANMATKIAAALNQQHRAGVERAAARRKT